MPTSPAELQSGLAIFGVMAFVAVVASLLTILASALLLSAYRRRVGAVMAAKAGAAVRTGGSQPMPRAARSEFRQREHAPTRAPDASSAPRLSGLAAALHRRIAAEPWRHALGYAAAGACFALFMASVYAIVVFQPQPNFGSFFHPYRFLYLFWTFAWPVVLATTIVTASSRRTRCGVIAGYFLVLAALGALATVVPTQAPRQWGDVMFPAWSTATPVLAVGLWVTLNALPTAAIIAFRHRRVRAVGPLVLGFMTVLTVGVLVVLMALFAKGTSDSVLQVLAFVSETFEMSVAWTIGVYFLVPGVICCAAFGALGWLLLLRIRRGYRRKTISDQSLSLDAIWLTFGFIYAMPLGLFGPGWVASGLPAFLIYKGTIRLANRRALATRPEPGYRLLLLRVFSLGKRTQALFDRVITRWRYVGSVQLIAGTDLAAATVAPHDFLSFLGGRLGSAFIGDNEALEQGVRQLDIGRDADGRFRVNDFFCYADTWQPVLTRLIGSSDVVLMDLRRFSQANAGCIFELNQLVNVAPAGRVVLIVDGTTDLPFLRRTLDDAWRRMRPDAPNLNLDPGAIEMVWLASLKRRDLDRLLRRLCAAVEAAALLQIRAVAPTQVATART